MTIPIREFPADGAPWRINTPGSLTWPEGIHGQPKIDVHLSALTRGSGDPLLNSSLANPERHQSISVNVDQIALLTQGSVWVNGVQHSPNIFPRTLKLTVNATEFSFIKFDGQVQIDGIGHPLITSARYRMDEDAFLAAAGTWLAVAYKPALGLEFVAIPCTAIFQKCAATSSAAVRRLLLGQIDKIMDISSGLISDDHTTFFAELFNDFRDDEAAAIANLLVDPVGRAEYARLRSTLVADSVNADRSRTKSEPRSHIKFGLPFVNDVEMIIAGKALAFDTPGRDGATTKWGFLATEIIHLKAKLVFDRIVIARKAGRGMKEGDEWSEGTYKRRVKASLKEAEVLQVSSAVVPSDDYEPVTITVSGGFVAENLETVLQESEVDKFRKRSKRSIAASVFNGVGATGDTRNQQNGVAPVNIAAPQTPMTPVTLKNFFSVLDLLAKDGYGFTTIALTKFYGTHGVHFVNYFPTSIIGSRSWHLMDYTDPPTRRAYVVAQLQLGGIWHYLVELERKSVPIALLHIRAHDGKFIEPTKIWGFMNSVARHNGWNAQEDYRNWIFMRINHPPVEQGKQQLSVDWVERFKQKIINFLLTRIPN